MVLKRRLPSTLSAGKKGEQNPSTQTPEVKVDAGQMPSASQSHQPKAKAQAPKPAAPKAMNPFEAQQQAHAKAEQKEEKPKAQPTHPVMEALKEAEKEPQVEQENPFSAPVPPKANVEASQSIIPEKKEPEIDFDNPFATPAPTLAEESSSSWAEEPTDKPKPQISPEMQGNGASTPSNKQAPAVEKTPNFEAKNKPQPKTPTTGGKDVDVKTVGLGLAAAGLVAVIGYNVLMGDKDETAEVVSRWTGALQEVSEALPEQMDISEQPTGKAQAVLQPEAVVVSNAGKEDEGEDVFLVEEEAFQAEPEDSGEDFVVEKAAPSTSESNSIVEFVDVSEEEVDQPIVASADEEMPEGIGVIAKMQNAIVKAREEKEGVKAKPSPKSTEDVPVEEVRATGDELSRQLEEELAEYRRILSGTTSSPESVLVSPEEFFGEKYEDDVAADAALAGGAIQLPKPERKSALLSESDAMTRYGDNPYNLPVVPEPGQGQDTIRTLSDFDMAIFDAPRTRVRMPKHIKPSLRATSFPPVLLLSTIPGRGVIAESNRRQGVLMLGESIEGWELVAVHSEYAEFKRGKKNHTLTLGH